jgi:hypothetical protein
MTDTPYTTRLNALERRVFARLQKVEWSNPPPEPALGTLAQRLDIIHRRLGGTTGPVAMTTDERLEYLRWLAADDPGAVNPWTGRPVLGRQR